jgi:hypothetical protein
MSMTSAVTELSEPCPRSPSALGEGRGFLWVTLCLSAAVPALFVTAYLTGFIGVKPGSLSDSDCYVHLLRAEKLWQTGRWYDPAVERSNAPYGEELHWTRPFDVLLLLGGAPGALFVGVRPALFWWGVILSPVLLGVTLAVLPWAVRPLLGREGSFTLGMLFTCQIGTWLVFQAGRPDHHSLIMLLFVLGLGFSFRMILYPFDRGICYGAGIVAALSLWASIESSLVVGLSCLAFAALWIACGGDSHRKALHYSGALSAGLVAALLIERPPANLGAMELDRLSVAHCVVFGLITAGWGGIFICNRRWGWFQQWAGRLFALIAGSATLAVLLWVFLPALTKGPLADVSPEVTRIYVRNVAEMRPLLASGPGRSLAAAVIGAAAICIPLLLRRVARGPRASGWLYVAAATGLFMPLSFLQIRWTPYTQVLLALPLAEIILVAWTRLDRWPYTLKRTLAKTGVLAACCYFLLLSGVVFDAICGVTPENNQEDHLALAPLCRYLTEAPAYAGRRLRILTDVFWGGEILYRTPHEVVGTPYHRNTQGILDTYRAFSAATDGQAFEVIRGRGINLVLVAPGSDRIRRFYGGNHAGSTFYQRLCDGQIPSWCRQVDLPMDLASFRLFEICPQPEASPTGPWPATPCIHQEGETRPPNK